MAKSEPFTRSHNYGPVSARESASDEGSLTSDSGGGGTSTSTQTVTLALAAGELGEGQGTKVLSTANCVHTTLKTRVTDYS